MGEHTAAERAQPFDVEAAESALNDADDMVEGLCQGEREWIMSIPARPHHDPDLVIGAGISAGERAVAEVKRLQRETATLTERLARARDAWDAWAEHHERCYACSTMRCEDAAEYRNHLDAALRAAAGGGE